MADAYKTNKRGKTELANLWLGIMVVVVVVGYSRNGIRAYWRRLIDFREPVEKLCRDLTIRRFEDRSIFVASRHHESRVATWKAFRKIGIIGDCKFSKLFTPRIIIALIPNNGLKRFLMNLKRRVINHHINMVTEISGRNISKYQTV